MAHSIHRRCVKLGNISGIIRMLISWFLMLILHFLLLFPVEIPKVKINVIFIIVVNALHSGLCDFIELTVMSL